MANCGNGCANGCCDTPQNIYVENPARPSTISDLGNCRFLHTSGDLTTTIISTDPEIELIGNCDGTITLNWKNGGSTTVDICKEVASGCNATLVVNPDGSLTFTDNAGAVTNVPVTAGSQMIDNGDGTFTHTSANGSVVVVDVCAMVGNNCSDQMIANPDGSFTHVSIDGTVTNIPSPNPSFNKVGATGLVTTFNPGTDRVPEFAFQNITDQDSDTISSAAFADTLTVHRTLGVGANSHLPGNQLGNMHADSDDVDTGVVTIHHTNVVLASTASRSQGGSAINIVSDNSNSSGTQSFNLGTITGAASGVGAGNISSLTSTASNAGSTNISSVNADSSGLRSSNIAVSGGAIASGDQAVNISSIGGSATSNGSTNIASNLSDAQLPFASNISSDGSDNQATFSSNLAALGSQILSGNNNANIATNGSVISAVSTHSVSMATNGAVLTGVAHSAAIGGIGGVVTDQSSVSLSGGVASSGNIETLAHGTPNGSVANPVTFIGFRGATPVPPRLVVTLADVILALQEQGLAL